jgi:hypothetical protein
MSITITHQAFSEALQSRDGRLDYCIRLQAERQLGAAVEFTASDQSFPCSLYSLTPAETKAARRLKFALNIDVFFGSLKAKLSRRVVTATASSVQPVRLVK